jgi:alkanesulfonate monooxygenase SsuD/methylene tetrahydromethanopterin reductase-like flavin-dependent oxidoreductase (luciferase family)
MRFGLGPFGLEAYADKDLRTAYADMLRLVDVAEVHGFDSAWVAERHFAEDGYCPAPAVAAAAIAARTTAMRIGILGILGLVHPLYVAEDAAVVDNASNGRVVFAPMNATPAEMAGYGVSPDEYDARFEESVEVLMKAWAANPFRHEGRFWQIPANMPEHGEAATAKRLTSSPKPAQLELPMWIAGFHALGTEMAGRLHVPLVAGAISTFAELQAAFAAYDQGTPAGARPLVRALIRDVWVAETTEQAQEECSAALLYQYQRYARWGLFDGDASEYEALARDRFLVGDPETVIGMIGALEQRLGVDYLICRMQFPGLPVEQVERSLVRFSQEVIPEFSMADLPTQIRTGV